MSYNMDKAGLAGKSFLQRGGNSHFGGVLDFVCHFVHHFVCDLP
jgi:hypothetical protein